MKATKKFQLWKKVVIWLIVILYFPVFLIIKYIIWCLSFLMINGDRIREALQELFDERYVFNGHISIL